MKFIYNHLIMNLKYEIWYEMFEFNMNHKILNQ